MEAASNEPLICIFGVVVRHPDTAKSYQEVEANLRATLRSITRQTDHSYRVIVVCHKLLEDASAFPYVDFILSEPIPKVLEYGFNPPVEAVRRDKGVKHLRAISWAKKYNSKYYMFCDADDLISNKLVAWLRAERPRNGAYVAHGFLYRKGSPFIQNLPGFHQLNGTSHILSFRALERLWDLNTKIPNWDSSYYVIEHSISHELLVFVFGGHRLAKEICDERHIYLDVIPFSAVVYVVGTGQNHSKLKGLHYGRLLSTSVAAEFGMSCRPMGFKTIAEWILEATRRLIRKMAGR